jgi:hypothetical protein
MKYTEAVALIEETFEMQGTGVTMRTKDAACILDALINAGMLPPVDPNEYDLVPTVTPTGNLDYSFKRGWEPE